MDLFRVTYYVGMAGGTTKRVRDLYVVDEESARSWAIRQGYLPVSVDRRTVGRKRAGVLRGGRRRAFARMVLQNLALQSGTAQSAEALLRVVESVEANPKKDARAMAVLAPARSVIDGGGTFGEALSATGLFDQATLAIVTSGESTRTLQHTLKLALEHLDATRADNAVLVTMVATMFVELQGIVAVLEMVQMYFGPQLRERAAEIKDVAERAAYVAKIDFAVFWNDLFLYGAYGIVAVAFLLGAAYFRYVKHMNHPVVRLVQRIPLLRGYFLDSALAGSWAVFARLVGAGAGFGQAVRVAGDTAWHREVRSYWEAVEERVLGRDPVDALCIEPLEAEELITVRGTPAKQSALEDTAVNLSKYRGDRAKRRKARMRKVMLLGGVAYAALGLYGLMQLYFTQSEGVDQIMKQFEAY